MDTSALIQIAKQAAIDAGTAAMEFYDAPEVNFKEGDSPVTNADIKANDVITEALLKTGIPILSEESADSDERLSSDLVWIIDPIDGTKDFIKKTSEFTIMIGLAKSGKSFLGVVYQPVTGTLYSAIKGQGAYQEIGDEKIKLTVSETTSLSSARILVSRWHESEAESEFAEAHGVSKVKCGSAGLKMCKVASAKAEIYINSTDRASQWDTCASNIILQEAGGRMTDLSGEEITYNAKETKHKNGYIVSNAHIHELIRQAL